MYTYNTKGPTNFAFFWKKFEDTKFNKDSRNSNPNFTCTLKFGKDDTRVSIKQSEDESKRQTYSELLNLDFSPILL